MRTSRSRVQAALAGMRHPRLLPVHGADYTVHLGRGPRIKDTPYADLDRLPVVVYWFGPISEDGDLAHELGHVVDHRYFTPGLRDRAKPLLAGYLKRKGERPPADDEWWWTRDPMKQSHRPDPWCEAWADAYCDMQHGRLKARVGASVRLLVMEALDGGPQRR